MRERWFGATGRRIPEVAVEGEDLELAGEGRVRLGASELPALVLHDTSDAAALRRAHAEGTPVVVCADEAGAVVRALEHPEVSCVLVPGDKRALRELDLRKLKYG